MLCLYILIIIIIIISVDNELYMYHIRNNKKSVTVVNAVKKFITLTVVMYNIIRLSFLYWFPVLIVAIVVLLELKWIKAPIYYIMELIYWLISLIRSMFLR